MTAKKKPARDPFASYNDEPSLTKQSGAMTPADHWRAFVAGQPLPERPPQVFGDLAGFDYARMRETVAEFNSAFEELPSHLRDTLDNDPANYLTLLEDNSQEIAENGLGTFLNTRRDPETGIYDFSPRDEEKPAETPENAQIGAENASDSEE